MSVLSSAELHNSLHATLRTLFTHEAWWRDRYDLFLSHGYQLRPRLRPGWVPSWTTNGKLPLFCEDSAYILPVKHQIVDAVKTSNGEQVLLKRVETESAELRIALYLSLPELREDPRNHCVPVLDHFQDVDDESITFMVMPLLRNFDKPKLGTVNELLDFGDQIFEGLRFMHEHGIAHRYEFLDAVNPIKPYDLSFRDCANWNVMMDAKLMYPEGFHPVHIDWDRSNSHPVRHYTRSERPPRYYFIDFGISSYFPPDCDPLVVGRDGRDAEVPELSDTVPYNPFKTDMFIIGNLLKKDFALKYSNVKFLYPLIAILINEDPNMRPTAFEAELMWKDVRGSVSFFHRYWRLRERDKYGYIDAAVVDFIFFVCRALRLSQWAPRVSEVLTGM